MNEPSRFIERPRHRVAFHHRAGQTPGLLLCGGFRSDMSGTKALALDAHCAAAGRMYTRFDYLGHGESGGNFAEGTLGVWRDDALAVLDTVTSGPQVVVGSSMGGWIALLLARARPERVHGLVLIAPAPDFTRQLQAGLSDAERQALARTGQLERASVYSDEPYVFTRALLEDGERHCLLDAPVQLPCPVHILHGTADADVAWQRSLELLERLRAPEVLVTLVKDGDHRLSTPADLARLCSAAEELCLRPPAGADQPPSGGGTQGELNPP